MQQDPYVGGCVHTRTGDLVSSDCSVADPLLDAGLEQFGTEIANQHCTECGPWDSKRLAYF